MRETPNLRSLPCGTAAKHDHFAIDMMSNPQLKAMYQDA